MELSPYKILNTAVTKIPAIKWALGVAGIASVVAIIAGFQLDMRIAVFGTMLVVGLMFVLVAFSALAAHASNSELILIALFATWSFMALLVTSSFLLMSSYFFAWPKPLEGYLPTPTNLAIELFSTTNFNNPDNFILNGHNLLRLIPGEILLFRLSVMNHPYKYVYSCFECTKKQVQANEKFIYSTQNYPGISTINLSAVDANGDIAIEKQLHISIAEAKR